MRGSLPTHVCRLTTARFCIFRIENVAFISCIYLMRSSGEDRIKNVSLNLRVVSLIAAEHAPLLLYIRVYMLWFSLRQANCFVPALTKASSRCAATTMTTRRLCEQNALTLSHAQQIEPDIEVEVTIMLL